MKVLILGMLGAGKSSLSYYLNHTYNLPTLNLDEVCRNPQNGSYYSQLEKVKKIEEFVSKHENWVMEGCQKELYTRVKPDVIIVMQVSRLTAIWRFVMRFFKAYKLRGKQIDSDLPVQAYHYRKPTIKKIMDWDQINRQIQSEIADFIHGKNVVFIKGRKDYHKMNFLENKQITKTHFGIYGVIKKEGKILLIQKARGPYTGLYDLPGGSPKEGEKSEQTLRREIKEETGCDVVKFSNPQRKSIIFSDFTKASAEHGILKHDAILFDLEIEGKPSVKGDGLDSNGAMWIDMEKLSSQNATPYALMASDKEMLDIVDDSDIVFNILPRQEAHQKKQLVRIAGVLVLNEQGQILLQKASQNKASRFAGKWTYSAAGHVDCGESYEQAAVREVKEELGIDIKKLEYIGLSRIIHEKTGKLGAFHRVFRTKHNGPFKIDKAEMDEVRFFSFDELRKMLKISPECLNENLIEILKLIVK